MHIYISVWLSYFNQHLSAEIVLRCAWSYANRPILFCNFMGKGAACGVNACMGISATLTALPAYTPGARVWSVRAKSALQECTCKRAPDFKVWN